MRLLITGINWPPETFLQRLIEGLVRAGVHVTVGTATRPAGMEDRVDWLNTPSWETPVPLRMARLLRMAIRAWMYGSADVRKLIPFVRRHSGLAQRWCAWNQWLPYAGRRWDLVYFPWNSAAIGNLPIFHLASPVVVSCRGTQVSVAPHSPQRPEIREGLRGTFEQAAAVHCVSGATLKDALVLGLSPEKTRVIRPAVDTSFFQPVPSRPRGNAFRVITTGTLIWVKGHEWALQAIRLLVDLGVDARFEIIGDGPDRQRVLYTIHDLGLQDRVHLHGKLKPEEVLAQLQQADVFLLSSLSEGISNAVLEAMACGLPVVTTDCGGMREAVTDQIEGFVVPVRNAEAIADRLQLLARDSLLWARMGTAARARIEREFTLDRQIEQWLELLNRVASRRASMPEPAPADPDRLNRNVAAEVSRL